MNFRTLVIGAALTAASSFCFADLPENSNKSDRSAFCKSITDVVQTGIVLPTFASIEAICLPKLNTISVIPSNGLVAEVVPVSLKEKILFIKPSLQDYLGASVLVVGSNDHDGIEYFRISISDSELGPAPVANESMATIGELIDELTNVWEPDISTLRVYD